MMTVHFTCPQCQSGVHVYPSLEAKWVDCPVCKHEFEVQFTDEHVQGVVKECPMCQRKDFFIQKDFNRKIGVILFLLASVLAIFTYGLSFIALYLVDYFLFQKLHYVVVCYKCETIFRQVKNWKEIPVFNHEMHDRIIYSDHNFHGKPLPPH